MWERVGDPRTLMTAFSSKLKGNLLRSGAQPSPAGASAQTMKELVRTGDWRGAARIAAELGDEDKLVRYALMSGFGRLPEGKVPDLAGAAEMLSGRGQHEEAVLLFEAGGAFTRAAESAMALRQPLRAAYLFKQARAWERAVRCFEEAAALPEAVLALEEGEARLERGGLRRQADQDRLRQLKLKRAEILIRLDRSSAAVALLRAQPPSPEGAALLEGAGRIEEAMERYLDLGLLEEAARVAAKSPQRERLQAQIYLRTGRPVQAAEALARLGRNREAAEAYEAGKEWNLAGYRWEATDEPARAAEAYEKGGRPRDAARCFQAAGMPERAAAAAAPVKQPSGALAQRDQRDQRPSTALRQARASITAGDTAKAASILMLMRPGEAGFAEGAVLLAPLLIAEGFGADALDRLRVPLDGSHSPEAEARLLLERDYWQGRCLEAMQRHEEALACYERAAARDLGYRDLKQRLDRRRASTAVVAPQEPPAPMAHTSRIMNVPPALSPGELAVGGRLGERYEILAELGRGGMGRVYKARDHELGEIVAIKTLLTSSDGGVGDEARLLREVQICRRISHPNVVRVYDLGRFNGGLFVTMELIEGNRLDDVIALDAPLPFAQVRSLVADIAAGLKEAHAQGIVHRDLKPTNLIVTAANRLKILDFGIASMAGLGSRLTQVGFVMGSPMFMSPDQIRGGEVDGRSDLYSLGLIAYALITGREPFELLEATALVFKKLAEDPSDVRELRPETPESWVALLSRLLARQPEHRFQSAQEVLDALAKLPD